MVFRSYRNLQSISLLNSHKSIPADLQQFEQCARIADALYNYTKKDDELIEECLQFWFCTFIRLYTSGAVLQMYTAGQLRLNISYAVNKEIR